MEREVETPPRPARSAGRFVSCKQVLDGTGRDVRHRLTSIDLCRDTRTIDRGRERANSTPTPIGGTRSTTSRGHVADRSGSPGHPSPVDSPRFERRSARHRARSTPSLEVRPRRTQQQIARARRRLPMEGERKVPMPKLQLAGSSTAMWGPERKWHDAHKVCQNLAAHVPIPVCRLMLSL